MSWLEFAAANRKDDGRPKVAAEQGSAEISLIAKFTKVEPFEDGQ